MPRATGQQAASSDHVCLREWRWIVDPTINVGLGRQMDHGIWPS
jgi:hypothetical protein